MQNEFVMLKVRDAYRSRYEGRPPGSKEEGCLTKERQALVQDLSCCRLYALFLTLSNSRYRQRTGASSTCST